MRSYNVCGALTVYMQMYKYTVSTNCGGGYIVISLDGGVFTLFFVCFVIYFAQLAHILSTGRNVFTSLFHCS